MRKNKAKINIKIILACGVIIFLLILAINLNNKNNINKTKVQDYTFNIAGVNIAVTDDILGEANKPQLGAGMIPIKYDEGIWRIASEQNKDNSWYDYENGKMATVMLSDGGYYVAEPQQNMLGQAIASNEVGSVIEPDQLGTIFVWIPRMSKLGDDDFVFLKDYSIINYDNYEMLDCFSYLKDGLAEFAFKGVWVAKYAKGSQTDANTQINSMKKEENIFGLIKNELVEMYAKGAVTSAKLYQSKFQNQTEQKINDIENTNRAMIRIVSINNMVPLTAKARVEKENGTRIAKIEFYSEYGIYKILNVDRSTNTVVQELSANNNIAKMPLEEDGKYYFALIDMLGNIQSVTVNTIIGIPDLTGFRLDNTYIVTYDDETNFDSMDSSVKINDIVDKYSYDKDTNALIDGEININKVNAKIGNINKWFNYSQSKWANIVVRNNGNEAYFVWIPRYVYKLNEEEETTEIKFISIDNQDVNGEQVSLSEWTLPEAFTWEGDTGTVQLTGFWATKYKLSDKVTFAFNVDVYSGLEEIIVSNLVDNNGLSSTTFDYYIYKNGVDKTQLDNEELMLGDEKWQVAHINTGDIGKTDYRFANIPAGTYQLRVVLSSNGIYKGEIWKDKIYVTADELPKANEPDLTGFKINTTYVVAYDDAENMTDFIPISDVLKDIEIDKTLKQDSLKSGKIDQDKVESLINSQGYTWYDYDNSKWANIVVRNGGGEIYYTWVPRYIYKLSTGDGTNAVATEEFQTTEIIFVTPDQDLTKFYAEGWVLPEAFTWESDSGTVQLNGFWATKYKLSDYTNFNIQLPDDSGIVGEMNRVRINNITDALDFNHYKVYLYDTEKLTNKIQSDYDYELTFKDYEYYAEPQIAPIADATADNGYDCSNTYYVRYAEIDKTGLTENRDKNQITFKGLRAGTYCLRIAVFDDAGHYRGEKWYYNIKVVDQVDPDDFVVPDLTGFKLNTTYIVAYNNNEEEQNIVPISKILINPEDDKTLKQNTVKVGCADVDFNKLGQLVNKEGYLWYDYNNSKWANIVVRNGGGEVYYTWVPRYAYKVDNIREETFILFLRPEDTVPEGWTLPEAFTWESDNGNIQLPGFWATKYKLSDYTNFNISVPSDSGIIGELNRIRIHNITDTQDFNHYKLYLYEEDKLNNKLNEDYGYLSIDDYQYYVEPEQEPRADANADHGYDCSDTYYVRYTEIDKTGITDNRDVNYTVFNGLNKGTYILRVAVYDDAGHYRGDQWFKNIKVEDKATEKVNVDLTGFNKDITYYLTYDGSENEIKGNNLNGSAPDNWYDYENSKWANIVVDNTDVNKKAYFVWVPRYAYKVDNIREETLILFLNPDDPVPEGWTLPESFTWESDTGTVQLSGFWATKYKLSE